MVNVATTILKVNFLNVKLGHSPERCTVDMAHYFRPFDSFRESLDTQDFLILRTLFPQFFFSKMNYGTTLTAAIKSIL